MNINKLKKLAVAANKGEWSHFKGVSTNSISLDGVCDGVVHWKGFDSAQSTANQARKNAAFIAAFNPSVALEMIDKIESMPPYIKFRMPDRDQYCGEDYDQVYAQFAEALADAGIVLLDQDGEKFALGAL